MRFHAALTGMLALAALAQPVAPPLIPRELLLGTPARSSPALAPDGRRLAFLAPDERGVVQAWVRTVGRDDDACVTRLLRRGLSGLAWTEDSGGLLAFHDAEGDGSEHVLLVDLASRNVRDLTAWQGVRAQLLATSPRVPDQVLVEANVRDRTALDVVRVNLRTGAVELDTQNPGDVEQWLVDGSLTVRGARAVTPAGGTELRVRDSSQAPFRPLVAASVDEHLAFVDFTDDGRSVLLATSVDADTDRVVEKSLRTGAERLLGRSEKSDLLATLGAAGKRGVRALAFEVAGRLAWTPIDWRVKEDLDGLRRAVTGDFVVLGADRADGRWVVEERRDVAAPRYLLWDRKARRAEVLFSARPGLAGLPLVERQALSLVARDGQGLAGYLARPARAGSLVVLVQGGPAERDGWGYDGLVQLLANRGHAVLQVNARGSSGAGKRFLAAGNRAPGLLLEDDLVDAAAWAVREGLAEPARVAVMGVGPGGAVALAALARAPDAFACGVDLEGPLSPASALASLPAWRAAARPRLRARLGLLESPPDAGAESPAERVKAPLLLATRGLEGSAPHDEARRLVAALRARGVEVTWVTSPELVSPERRLDLVGRAEAFLARCLQGRAEPPAAPEAR